MAWGISCKFGDSSFVIVGGQEYSPYYIFYATMLTENEFQVLMEVAITFTKR